jgi:hypothetical protein
MMHPIPAPLNIYISQPGMTLTQVLDTLNALADPTDTNEGGVKDQLEEYGNFWRGRVLNNDSSGINMFDQYTLALRAEVLAGEASPCAGTGTFQGNWKCIGPDKLPIQSEAFVTDVWSDVSDSNYILVGSVYSGLFKTVDGGMHWACITDNAPLVAGVMGVSHIEVNPLNKNTIFLATTAASILESYDGGNTWQQEFIGSGTYTDTIAKVQGVFFTPDSLRIYALRGDSVFTRSNATGVSHTWQNITPPGSYKNWCDMKFVPGNQNHFFISNIDYTSAIFESDIAIPTSSDWSDITTSLSASLGGTTISPTDWGLIALSMPDVDTLFFLAYANNAHANIYKYSLSDAAIHLVYSDIPNATGYQNGKGQFIASSASTGTNRCLYYGWDVPYQSYDGGRNFYQIGTYHDYPTHGDIRAMFLQKATNTTHGSGDRLLIANDGGVSKKPSGVDITVNGTGSTIDISGQGLYLGMFNWFYTSEAGGIGLGGMMHDGVNGFEPDQPAPWKNINDVNADVDAWTTTFNLANPKVGYTFNNIYPVELDVTVGGSGRIMDALGPFPQPPNIPSVGPCIGTDYFGNIYCGTDQLYVKTPGSSSFAPVGAGFPTGGFIVAVEFSPYSSEYNGYAWYLNLNKIYYRNSAIPGFGTALPTNDVPNTSTYPMTCLVTDPLNTERIWVGQGKVNLSNVLPTTDRVRYSPDHGTTWIDVSSGLPQRLPITGMVYDEAENAVYASTDAGIFKCDFSTYNPASTVSGYNSSVNWVCFNTGLISGHNFPNVQVNKLVINHCQGKLYAATNGRSVWSTDIYINPKPTDTIKSSVNWIGLNQYINAGITIPSGVTLTISHNDTVHMPKGGVIAVLPGGHLIVDSSEITNDCDQCMWQGIQARGQVSLPQYPSSNQGWVTIRNGSTIQHAMIGVSNNDQSVVWSSNGGIVQCANSYFINNHEAASLLTYDNIYADHSLHPNLSYFSNCTFLLDNNYKGNTINLPMQYMVYLGYVEGVRFSGCQFLNRDTFAINRGIGEGIHAINTGFTVVGYCASPFGCIATSTQPSRFCGFTNGIDIQNAISPGLTVSIDNANFDSVSVGELVTGFSNVSTTRSNFIVGHGYSTVDVHSPSFTGCYQNIGILDQNSAQFRMEGNTFIGKPNHSASYWYNYGAVVANTGYDHINDVYRNTFGDSLTMSVFSLGCNKSFSGTTGLIATCNNFSNNANDVYVASDGSTAYMQGMAIAQGSSSAPAGNNFYGSTHNIVNNGSPVDYFYDGYLSAIQAPYDYSSGTATVGLYGSLAANSCPSSFTTGTTTTTSTTTTVGLDRPVLAGHKSAFQSNKTRFIDSTAAYNSRIDFGNTDSLLTIIGSSSDTVSLYSILSSGAPYISETALQTVGDLMKIPHHSIMNILQQNPDNLTDNNFVTHMQLDYSLSSSDLATLAIAAQAITARTNLQNIITSSQINMANEGNIIMMALKSPVDTNVSVNDTTGAGICTDSTNVFYMTDSNSYYVDMDSVDTWLQNIGGLWTQYDRVGYYNFMGQYSIADSIFTSMASSITIPSIDWDTHNSYSNVWTAIHTAELAGRTVYQLTPTEIAGIDTFSAPLVTYNSGLQAAWSLTTGVITSTTTTVPSLPLCITGLVLTSGHRDAAPGGINGGNVISPIVNINSDGSSAQFAAYPNPTTGMVTFSYNVPNDGITITITNVVGEKVSELSSGNNSGNLYWNPNQLPTGLYLYQAQNKNGNISKGKLILAR